MPSIFLHPALLIALAAFALPWIIEWLFRRRKRHIELPTIRFLLDNQEQKKVRRQDFILLLRMVAIVLCVLAVARPMLRESWVGNQRERQVIILIDATASMQQQVDVTTSFGLAQKKAAGVVRALPAGSKVTVVMLTDRAEPVIENEGDLLTAAARIESLRPTVGAAPMSAGVGWVKEFLAKQSNDSAELYLFSDFQTFTWQRSGLTGELTQAFNELGTSCETFLVDVGGHANFNYLVSALRPEEFVLSAGKTVKLLAEVQTRGQPPADARANVTFLVDGDKKAVREAAMTGRPVPLDFEYRFPKAGKYVLEVQIDGDDYRLDNRRQYLCRVFDDLRILILDETAETPNVETSFFGKSIRPPSHPGVEKPSHFDVKTIRPSRSSYENLSSYAVVVLAGTTQINESMASQLEHYVADGGSLWLFLNDNVNLYDYNKFLLRDGKGLLPGQLLEKSAASVDAKDPAVFPRYGESSHPAMSQFARLAGNNEAAFRRWLRIDVKPPAITVLPLSNGVPALVEKPFGRGKVLLANFTPGLDWSILPVLPEFPMLVQEILRYLVGNADADVNLTVGDRFAQPVLMSNQHLLLRCPDGSKHRLTPQKQTGNADAYQIVFDQTTQQGLYQIEAIEEVVPRRRFVVNVNPEESDLSRLNKAEVAELMPMANATWIGPETSIEDLAAKLHTITELFPWLVGILAGVLAVESLQAWRFGRRRGGGIAA